MAVNRQYKSSVFTLLFSDPNRLLLYIGRIYEKLIDNKKLYSSKQLSIPRPEFIVLYNGPGECPASSVVKLSNETVPKCQILELQPIKYAVL
ncbi:hypothetical protein AGMMS50230_02430 [Spirochaetia bacterium]|nr:hypothetical protein AGMMS50230_02430 [Spirochaetia bacterium]